MVVLPSHGKIMNIETVCAGVERLVAQKEQELEKWYPNNHTAAEFLEEAQVAERKTSIAFLQRSIRELRSLLVHLNSIPK